MSVQDVANPANNLWVLISALLVFLMTAAVGFLEIGELGEDHAKSLLKTVMISGSALIFMALFGFNIAFAPTINGLIGNPAYGGFLLGGFSPNAPGLLSGVWWSMATGYLETGITLGTYFIFETAFASVTLALVGVIVLKKIKSEAFLLYSIVYFLLIWGLPAAWMWNPTGWLYMLGARDFAGGLVVHGAAGAAGLGLVLQVWREEKKKGFKKSPQVSIKVHPGWLTLSIMLLWIGWFGFNPGSRLAIDYGAEVVVLTTFLAASSSLFSTMFFRYLWKKERPGLLYAVNGTLMGLIVITPLAGFVSPGSAIVLGIMAGPLFLAGESLFSRLKWFTDPVGLFAGHALGGLFGTTMVPFLTQKAFATASGFPTLPDGLLFGGGYSAVNLLGLQTLAIATVMPVVFLLSFFSAWALSRVTHGITTDYGKERIE